MKTLALAFASLAHARGSGRLQSSVMESHSSLENVFARFLVAFGFGAAFNPSTEIPQLPSWRYGRLRPLRLDVPSRGLAGLSMAEALQLQHVPKTREDWVAALGDRAHGVEIGAKYYDFFSSVATSHEFVNEIFARKPMLYSAIAGVADSFNFDALQVAVDSDFLDAQVGDADRGGWQMENVAEPRGNSFEDAKVRYMDIEAGMKKGTVFLNSAASHVPRLGTVSLAALDAMGVPNCLNLYLTAKGIKKSAPPHTDKQDVFVCQSSGSKHWRVFDPPSPLRKPQLDPMARGKINDALQLSELGEPVLDCVLKPGDVLYVPAGFPHTTDTVNTDGAGAAADADSLHLTIGLDTHIWGLDYASMRKGALARAKLPDTLNVNALPAESYWHLMKVPSSLGFLRNQAQKVDVASELIESAKVAEPSRWKSKSDLELGKMLGATEVKAQVESHATQICQLQRDMYLDAANDVLPPQPPGLPRVTIFRVEDYFKRLKAAMDEHLQWYSKSGAAGGGAPTQATSGFGSVGGGARKSVKGKSKSKSKRKKR